MSEEQDCIVITLENDSDDNNTAADDDDVVVIEDSDSEVIPDTSTHDSSILHPDNDSAQEQVQVEQGVEGAVALDDQAVPQVNCPVNVKRHNSNLMDFIPPNKRGRALNPTENDMNNASADQEQTENFQENCEGLHGLIDKTNRQVSQLCGMISKIRHSWEQSQMLKCGHCNTSFPEGSRVIHGMVVPPEIPLQQMIRPEHQQPNVTQDSSVPRIIPTNSLLPSVRPESPVAEVTTVSCIYCGGARSANAAVSSDQPTMEAQPVFLLPEGPSTTNNPDQMNYSAIPETEGMNASAALPALFFPFDVEMVGSAEANCRNDTVTMNDPTVLENDGDQGDAHPPVFFHSFDAPVVAEANLENNPEMMNCQVVVENDNDQHSVSSSGSPPSDSDIEKVILVELPGKAEVNGQTIYYPALLGSVVAPDSETTAASISSNILIEKVILIEMPVSPECMMENNPQVINDPPELGNASGQDPDSSSHSAPRNCEMLDIEGRPQMMDNPPVLENDSNEATFLIHPSVGTQEVRPVSVNHSTLIDNGSDEDNGSSVLFITPGFEMLDIEGRPQMMDNPPVLENDSNEATFLIHPSVGTQEVRPVSVNHSTLIDNGSDEDNGSSVLFITPGFEMLDIEGRPQMMDNPPVLENDSNEATFLIHPSVGTQEVRPVSVNHSTLIDNGSDEDNGSSVLFITPGFGYLGDPKRNIKVLNVHLLTAQNQAKPRYAARYLVHVLFSEETLAYNSLDGNSLFRPFLDPNKMAAIREFLASVFPNCDLSEYGNDWKTCVSDIRCLIHDLYSETKDSSHVTAERCNGPGHASVSTCANWNGEMNDDGGEGSSQLPQQMGASGTEENCNVVTVPEKMVCFGNPRRNIQIPYSVMKIAKAKSRPELSARYLIRNLFTEEVLIRSNVYGGTGRGIRALHPNRINALREFLQDTFPSHDLEETGHEWKLCVSAINSCIRSLRHEQKRAIAKSRQLPETTPSSMESEPRDPNETNSST